MIIMLLVKLMNARSRLFTLFVCLMMLFAVTNAPVFVEKTNR